MAFEVKAAGDVNSGAYPSVENSIVTGTTVTMSQWVKTSDSSTVSHSMGIANSGFYYCSIVHNWHVSANPSALTFYFDTNSGSPWYIGTETTGFYDGNWHNVTVTRNGATLKIYIDGVSQTIDYTAGTGNTGSVTFDAAPALGNLYNAATSTASNVPFLSGRIAEAAIWTRVLSAGEIANLAVVSPAFIPVGRARYYPCKRTLQDIDTGDGLYFASADTPLANDIDWVSDHPPVLQPAAQVIPFAGGPRIDSVSTDDILPDTETDWNISGVRFGSR